MKRSYLLMIVVLVLTFAPSAFAMASRKNVSSPEETKNASQKTATTNAPAPVKVEMLPITPSPTAPVNAETAPAAPSSTGTTTEVAAPSAAPVNAEAAPVAPSSTGAAAEAAAPAATSGNAGTESTPSYAAAPGVYETTPRNLGGSSNSAGGSSSSSS